VVGLVWGTLAVIASPPSDAAISSSGTGASGGSRPFVQRPTSGRDTRRDALAQARLWLWPWLNAYSTLYVISLVVAVIRIEHASGPAPFSADDLVVSVGGLVVWSLVIGTHIYHQMTLSRGLAVGVLAIASLLTLATSVQTWPAS
jgi:hypothetical protein